MLLSVLAAAAAAVQVNCADPASVQAAWQPGIEAFQKGDAATAKAVTDGLIAACGTNSSVDHPRLMRAIIAVSEKDYDGALTALGPSPRPGAPPLGAYSSFAALAAHAGKKDAAAFAAERDRLVTAIGAGLTDPRGIKGKLVETFEVNGARVQAFEARFSDGTFNRHFVFLVVPPEPFAGPRTFMLTTHAGGDILGEGRTVYFLDEYGCQLGHLTLDIAERRPNYKKLKGQVEARLKDKLAPVSGTQGSDPVCAFPGYVAPGVGG